VDIDVADDCDVEGAIRKSGLLNQFPEINLEQMRLGIFGKFTDLDSPLKAGDRVEIYRPIIRDLDDDDDDEDE
jgi:uncharacterized protein